MPTYYFSRVSLTMPDGYIQKMEHLYNVLSTSSPIIFRRDYYSIINLLVRKVDNKSYITGQVVKYEAQRNQATLSVDNKIEDIVLERPLLGSVKFIYDANESLLIYEEDKSHIPKESFLERFKSLLLSSPQGQIYQIALSPITKEYHPFIDRLKEIAEIKKIRINLLPSNPNNRDRWKKIDEKLKEDNITHYREIQENKTTGGSVNVDKETEDKILMSQDGYGDTLAEGYDNQGKPVKISTKDGELQAKAVVESQESLDDEIRDMQNTIMEIKNKDDGKVQ